MLNFVHSYFLTSYITFDKIVNRHLIKYRINNYHSTDIGIHIDEGTNPHWSTTKIKPEKLI